MGGGHGKFDNSKWVGVKNEALDARYDIVRVLGQGAGGTAYLVKRKKDGADLVAKESHDMTPDGMAEFINEFENMKTYTHPNIVKVHELLQGQQNIDGEMKPQIILISELARGGDLHGFMKKAMEATTLTEEWTAHVFRKAMNGVAHLHARKMMHNDLKPDNILMLSAFDEANPDAVPEVVITDFGCATLVKDSKLACGDPRYAGPETWRIIKAILAGERIGNEAIPLYQADLWAMAAMLYELLSGGLIAFAYRSVTLDECSPDNDIFNGLRDAVLGPDEIIVKQYCPEISDEAESLLKQMFSKDGNQRPMAQQVLEHDWFNIKGHSLDKGATARLALRTIKSKAHAILLNAMATKLQREHYQDCLSIFQQVDTDHTGEINLVEFTKAWPMLSESKASICKTHSKRSSAASPLGSPTAAGDARCTDTKCEEEAKAEEAKAAAVAFRHADINKDNEIDFNEFLAATFDWTSQDKSVLKQALSEVFEQLDSDGSDGIEKDELKKIFGGALTSAQLDDTFLQIDRDGDGRVTQEELEHFLFEPMSEEDVKRFQKRETTRKAADRTVGLDGSIPHDKQADRCCTCLSLSVIAGVVLQALSKAGALNGCLALL